MEAARAEDEGSGALGQRRYVTVLFADVSDSSRHAEQLEAEDYSDLLAEFRRIAREVIPRHGGSIARLQGDGLLALFGHLEPREDDGRRATAAALELHAAVAQLHVGTGARAQPLRMHSGIHAGLVLVIEGDIERGRFDVVGEVPNTAARLCSLAATGEVLVSEETLGPHAEFFHAELLRRLPIRGRAAPLNVLRVEGRLPVERRIDATARRGVVPFIGRDSATGQLLAAAERARAGEPLVLQVVGEPGVGKTRLVEEFVARLDPADFHVLQGYCEGYFGAEPLQPFMQWIRRHLGRRSDGPADADADADADAGVAAPPTPTDGPLSPLADALLGGNRKTAPNPAVLVGAIVELIVILAQHQTLVLVLDDWQWADDASRVALESLLARRIPLLVVLASRPASEGDHAVPGAEMLHLQPLDAAESARAIAARLPLAHPFTVQEIYRQSGGTPLFIEELCHAAARGDFHGDMRKPGVAWINALVASRVAGLPEGQADLLRTASVGGFVFPVWLLQRMVGDAAAAAGIEALMAADFFAPGAQPGLLRFKHLLTREAVYGTVPPAQRRALHRRLAEVLDGAGGEDAFEWLEALAYHYNAAGVADKAADFAEAAGDKALAAMALDRARSQYINVLRSLDALPGLSRDAQLRWCAVAQKLGQACVFDPLELADGFPLFERAVALARQTGDENVIARAEYWLAYMNYSRGRPRASVRHAERALQHAQASRDDKLAVQVEATLGQALAAAGRYDRALPLLAQAVERKRQHSRVGSGTAIGSAYALARTGYTLADIGRFEESDAAFAESLRLLGDKVHTVAASVLEVKCAAHLWQGRWADAQAAASQGADVALRCRSRWMVAMGRALGACGAWAERGDAASLQMLREATQWIEERGGAISTSLNYGWLVEATATPATAAEARRHAARLFLRARAHDRQGEAMGCRALARLAMLHGDAQRAAHYMAQADAAADWRDSPRERAVNELARAELAALRGERSEAHDRARAAAEAFAAMGMPPFVAHANRVAAAAQ